MSAREIVCHLVNFTLDVGDFMTVLMVSMVETGESAKVGSGMIGCEGTFLVPQDSCNVVIQCGKGAVPEII